MAIQFQCSGCKQLIEVDDHFANRQAVCPYCRIVVVVPARSSLGAVPYANGGVPVDGTGDAPAVDPSAPTEPPAIPPAGLPTRPGAAPSGADVPPAGWSRPPVPPPPQSWEQTPGYGRSPGYPPPGYDGYGYDPRRDPRRAAAIAYGNYAMVCFIIATGLAAIAMVFSAGTFLSEVNKVVPPGTTQPSPEQIQKVQEAALASVLQNSWIAGTAFGTSFFGVVGFVIAIISLTKSTDNWRGWLAVVGCGVYTLCCCGSQVLGVAGHLVGV